MFTYQVTIVFQCGRVEVVKTPNLSKASKLLYSAGAVGGSIKKMIIY